jgi:ubiquinone/menaquinone biosynthesis C-methylase UbiE
MVGVDFAANAVDFCNRRYRTEALSFVRGDAEDLPLADRSFDVVLNVESSHCYPSVGRFLREAARVLRPGGHLLFADMRHRADLGPLREAFRDAGLTILSEEEITADVLRALALDNDRKLGLIRREVPAVFRPLFRCFAGIKDTSSYDSFRAGEWVYWRFVLRRDAAPGA